MSRTLLLLLCAATVSAADLTREDAEGRWRVVHQLAREMNDKALVREVEDAGKAMKSAPLADVDAKLRALESKVGVDPGGWSMHGQKIARIRPDTAKAAQALAPKLQQAMTSDDAATVRAAVAELAALPGYEPGVPDARRAGERAERHPLTSTEAAGLFTRALHENRSELRAVAAGKPIGNNMLRLYAGVVQGCVAIRPHVANRAELDEVIGGACRIMLERQQPAGFFPFPDLRGKNIRFGAMTDKLITAQPNAVKDGWIVVPDPDGGSQFDTGECGVALLAAAAALGRDDWKQAGLRAAEWALAQKCVSNFNYNAFSITLLCAAHRANGEQRWLDGALRKFRVGVAPGQTANGRWLDPHNARTVYHFILLRALNDLAGIAPAAEVDAVRVPATNAMIEEFAALRVTNTSFALREFTRAERLGGALDPRLREVIEQTASVIHARCARGHAGAAFTEIAALADAWPAK